MLIAWLEPPSARVQGDQIYRSRQPCADLAAFADTFTVCGHWLDPDVRALLLEADVVVLAQCVEIDLLQVIAERRRRGLPTVYEINDNFLEPRAFGGVGSFYRAPERRALTLQLAGAADALQVSTPYLGELFARAGQPLWTLPNAVEALAPLAPPTRRAGGLRLGWGGSAGHAPDLLAAMPALRRLLAELPDAQLAIMGPSALRPLFFWVPEHRLTFRRDGSFADYCDFLRGLDIALAPLCDTPFNRGRSDVKFVEYAAAGACAVVQRAPAYARVEDNVLAEKFADLDELVARVLRLAGSPERRAQLRARAYAYVATHRSRAASAKRRHGLLCRLWQAAPAAARGDASATAARRYAKLAEATRGHAHALHPERGRCVGFGPSGAHLFNGLLAAAAGDCSAADFTQAATAAPRDYLPALYLGSHARREDVASKALQRASKLAPHSQAVAHALASRALAARKFADVESACAPHLAGCLPYPPLAVLAHAGRAAAGDCPQKSRLTPVWPALAAQIDHPQLAQLLAAEALGEVAPADDDAASCGASGAALGHIALGALRRARHCLGGADVTGELTLAEALLYRRQQAWAACASLLAGPCRLRAPETRTWSPEVVAACLGLAAQAAQRRGQPSVARALARRASAAAGQGRSKKEPAAATPA